jgi:carbon storage regulator
MLVLSRRAGQKIAIGNDIIIEVLSVSGEGVRLGITAPHETSVHRFEVFTEIREANLAAEESAGEVEGTTLEGLAAMLRGKQE